MAPVIVCPASIEAETAKDESVGHVEWRVPAAVDNSGFQPTVTVIPALVPPVLLPIGNNSITYTAEDGNKNKARCTFIIIVTGLSLLLSVLWQNKLMTIIISCYLNTLMSSFLFPASIGHSLHQLTFVDDVRLVKTSPTATFVTVVDP